MAVTKVARAFAALVAVCGVTSLYAQKPAAPAPGATVTAAPPPAAGAAAKPGVPAPSAEVKLVFDREVFSYPGSGRRDPFKPLVGKESAGPLFDDLKLKGVIYSTSDPARSIVLIQDGAKRIYRLHRGDVVGNSRVVEIRPLAVRFAVENFGMIRNEVIELRAGAAEAEGLRQDTRPVPAVQPTAPSTGGVDFTKLDKATAKRMLDSLAAARRANAAKKKPGNDEPFQPEARR